MKIHITKINVAWTNKEDQAYLDKYHKPYARVGIQTQEHGKTWLSGFAYTGEKPLEWKVGDEVEVDVESKGQYTNFRIPKKNAVGAWTPELIEKLFTVLQRMELKIENLEFEEANEISTHSDEPDQENDPLDIPF